MHADARVDGHALHIDLVTRNFNGPGGTLNECRIFVDGRLEGRGGVAVFVYAGNPASDLPAVARIDSSRLVTVDLVYGIAIPVVELWQVPEPATPVTVRLGTVSIEEFESVSREQREEIEASAVELETRYPQSWFDRHRQRLRSELEFAYDVALAPNDDEETRK